MLHFAIQVQERETLQIITPTACRAAEVMPHCPCILLKKVLSPTVQCIFSSTVQCIWDNKYTWIDPIETDVEERQDPHCTSGPTVCLNTINLFEEKTARKIS